MKLSRALEAVKSINFSPSIHLFAKSYHRSQKSFQSLFFTRAEKISSTSRRSAWQIYSTCSTEKIEKFKFLTWKSFLLGVYFERFSGLPAEEKSHNVDDGSICFPFSCWRLTFWFPLRDFRIFKLLTFSSLRGSKKVNRVYNS